MFAIKKKYISFIALIAICFCFQWRSYGQELKDYSSSNLKYLAGESEVKGDYLTAAELYEELNRRKPNNDHFQYRLARNLHQSSQYTKAKELYSKLVADYKKDYPLAPFYLGRILIMEGNCKDAVKILDDFRKDYRGEKDDRRYIRMAKFSIEACTNQDFTTDKKIIVQPLPSEINGLNMEGAPLFESEDKIIYSSLQANPNKVYEEEEKLPEPKYYVAQKSNGEWKKSAELKQLQIANGYHAVSGTFNQDRTRFYVSACKDIYSSQKQCDLFRFEINNGNWSAAEKLKEPVNSRFQERHPAVGVDEKGRETLYFVSDREEGKGGFDIWYSTYYEKKDEYREPKNCGSKVNSVGDEITPFVDPESGVLFFSSDAHPGIGGFDVFRSTGTRSKWMEPTNLGSAVNGPMDELYYTLDPSGRSGLFVSNRTYNSKKQPCCDDLFYFTDPDLISISYDGSIQDEDGETLQDVKLMIYEVDDSTGEEYLRKSVTTSADGSYKFRLEPNRKYRVKAEKDGYFTYSKDVSTMGLMSSRRNKLDINLEKFMNKTFILKNIYYDFDDDALTKSAMITIDTTIYKILVNNPTIVVEIGSHTDSKGRAEYNINLSQRRAASVVKYLIKKGIRKDRLSSKGYGETQPIAPNTNADGSDNPVGRAENRRTEFKVIGQVEVFDDED